MAARAPRGRSLPTAATWPNAPMLAVPGPLPRGDGWAYEVKWDGVRAVAEVTGGTLRLTARTGADITGRYPELTELVDQLGNDAVLDGEVVLLDADGRPSFQMLQRRMHIADPAVARALARTSPVALMIFDVMSVGDSDLRAEAYDARRAALEGLGIESAHVRVPAAHRGDPAPLVEFCTSRGLEGIVAKRRASPYRNGRRSPDWIKHKLVTEQELVVVGWTQGERARASTFGALLLGRRARPGGPLLYAGRVGSGFRDDELRRWTELLRANERAAPTVVSPLTPRGARWAEPLFVAQVRFTEWTEEGIVRHSTYRGQRDDIDPADVVVELPGDVDE